METSYIIATLMGALIVGILFGLVPLILGIKKNQKILAWSGMAACVVSGLIAGMLLAVPVCIVFTIIIVVRGKQVN